MSEDLQYQLPEQEKSMASEPAVGYETRQDTPLVGRAYDDAPTGSYGFYTEDPEEFERHKNQLLAEARDVSNAIPSEQMWGELRNKHLWLK